MLDLMSLWSRPLEQLTSPKMAVSAHAECVLRHSLEVNSKIDRRWPSQSYRFYRDARDSLTPKNRYLIEGLVLTSALVTPSYAGARNPLSEMSALAMHRSNDTLLSELPHVELGAGLRVIFPRLVKQADSFLRDVSSKRGQAYRACEGLVDFGREAYSALPL